MGEQDFYSLLGVSRTANTDELRRAYRESALRLHPDRNRNPGETELFLRVSQAYEILIDREQRAEYDKELQAQELENAQSANFRCKVIHSRKHLLQLDEPQVHYLLLDITQAADLPEVRPPINLSIVIDRSTSMRGQRLDQVRSAALAILKDLSPIDSASIVAFSDKAEVIVSPSQARDLAVARSRLSLLQAGGGTEIGQGIELGLQELEHGLTREGVNHLILLTDGRTYGDDDLCMRLAARAAESGVTINGVGIGSDWSDRLLDDLSSRTGGNVLFLDTPRAITELLQRILDTLSRVVATRVRLDGAVAQEVDLRSAFRLSPEPMPMGDTLPMILGNLPRSGNVKLLLELVIHPIGQIEELTLAHFTISGDLVGPNIEERSLPIQVRCMVSQEPDPTPPAEEIVSALSLLALYRMQEKARHEAELGESTQAARRLENLATQLLATGERDLAKAALSEAERLTFSRHISTEGEKVLKYGTRALLLLPAKSSAP
jgi:Ca-activated chloride channel family protein